MTGDLRRRPWLAAALAFVYPGLGHVYVRAWLRALLWFGAVVLTAVVFVPSGVYEGIGGISDVPAAASQVPTEAALAVMLVTGFNVLDAYLTAKRANASVDGHRCHHCRKEVDQDLSFCHWCTTELNTETA